MNGTPDAVRTMACESCGAERLAMRCVCEDIWLCHECCLTAVHGAECAANLAAIAAYRARRDDYLTELGGPDITVSP